MVLEKKWKPRKPPFLGERNATKWTMKGEKLENAQKLWQPKKSLAYFWQEKSEIFLRNNWFCVNVVPFDQFWTSAVTILLAVPFPLRAQVVMAERKVDFANIRLKSGDSECMSPEYKSSLQERFTRINFSRLINNIIINLQDPTGDSATLVLQPRQKCHRQRVQQPFRLKLMFYLEKTPNDCELFDLWPIDNPTISCHIGNLSDHNINIPPPQIVPAAM